jgi:hypothetical protein
MINKDIGDAILCGIDDCSRDIGTMANHLQTVG